MFMLDLNCPDESGNMTSYTAEICYDKDLQPDKPMKLAEQTLFKSKGLYSILHMAELSQKPITNFIDSNSLIPRQQYQDRLEYTAMRLFLRLKIEVTMHTF